MFVCKFVPVWVYDCVRVFEKVFIFVYILSGENNLNRDYYPAVENVKGKHSLWNSFIST